MVRLIQYEHPLVGNIEGHKTRSYSSQKADMARLGRFPERVSPVPRRSTLFVSLACRVFPFQTESTVNIRQPSMCCKGALWSAERVRVTWSIYSSPLFRCLTAWGRDQVSSYSTVLPSCVKSVVFEARLWCRGPRVLRGSRDVKDFLEGLWGALNSP